MELRLEKTGAERKALVAAISEITGEKSKYLGAPGFAYRVGGYIISKDGTVDTGSAPEDGVSFLLSALAERGFVPTVADATAAEEPVAMAIELSADGFSDMALDNLKKLAAGKAALIRRALGDDLADGAETLPIIPEDGRIQFPWFRFDMSADNIAAWSCFIAMLCKTAKKQKHVILREKPLVEGDSEKFAMRCFLLKLGFIGEEYKEARRVILSKLAGDGSHKRDKGNGAYTPAVTGEPVETVADGPAAGAGMIHGVPVPFIKDDEGERLVRGGLCCVPPSDGNYASYLSRATDAQLHEAVAIMESAPGGHKGRIAVCRRELKRRGA